MPVRGAGRLRVASESRRSQLMPSAVLGMLIFVFSEVMFFAGLISAFAIIRASAFSWPPPNQPRLPVEQTALNTVALLLSGVLLVVAHRRFQRDPRRASTPLLLSMLLGAFFIIFQGLEWVALLRQGLTLTSSTLGSFFYLIIGLHALHAAIALVVLASAWLRLRQGWLASTRLAAAEVFWYFVVGVWPILYLTVYL